MRGYHWVVVVISLVEVILVGIPVAWTDERDLKLPTTGFKHVALFNLPNPNPGLDERVLFKVKNGSVYPLVVMFRGPDGADIMLRPKEEKELILHPGWYAQVVTSKDKTKLN